MEVLPQSLLVRRTLAELAAKKTAVWDDGWRLAGAAFHAVAER